MAEILWTKDLREGLFSNSAISIGVFDGVHTGHRKVIAALLQAAREAQVEKSILMTFDRHPLSIVHPEMEPKLLTTLDEKISLLQEMGVDVIMIEEFDRELAGIGFREFISERLVSGLGMRHLVIGYDFHLGRDRMGNQAQLAAEGRRLGFSLTVVPPVVVRGISVSSTRIRRNVDEKKLSRAARLLTRPYFFDADVIRGAGIGRTMDFPTANVRISHCEKLVPPGGVYAVRVETGGTLYGGMMNIGSAPTVHSDGKRRIEVNLFDYSDDLYGKRLRIHCLEYLREEKEFGDKDELQRQLFRDKERITSILEKNH